MIKLVPNLVKQLAKLRIVEESENEDDKDEDDDDLDGCLDDDYGYA